MKTMMKTCNFTMIVELVKETKIGGKVHNIDVFKNQWYVGSFKIETPEETRPYELEDLIITESINFYREKDAIRRESFERRASYIDEKELATGDTYVSRNEYGEIDETYKKTYVKGVYLNEKENGDFYCLLEKWSIEGLEEVAQ